MIFTRKAKKWIAIIAAILVGVSLLVVIGNLSSGFQNGPKDWDLTVVNEDNLYQAFSFADNDGILATGEKGVAAKINEDNVVSVNGEAEGAVEINIGTYTLKANTSYVFDSSYEGTKGTAYVVLVDASGNDFAACYSGETVIPGNSIGSDMEVTLVMKIADGTDVNAKLKPVLVEGTSANDLVSFYK